MMKTNYEIRYAAHPEDAKHYDTARLRRDFLMETIFVPDEVNMVYSMYDRMIVGGAMPVAESLRLEAIDPLKAEYFTQRRELGIYNVGGAGTVKVGEETFELDFKEALYVGRGDREVVFSSKDAASPAKFYFNSCRCGAHGFAGDVERAQHQQDDCESGAAHLSAADGHDRTGTRLRMEHDARPRAQPPHGGLFLFRAARGSGRLPLHGRATGDAPYLDARRPGRALTGMEHP